MPRPLAIVPETEAAATVGREGAYAVLQLSSEPIVSPSALLASESRAATTRQRRRSRRQSTEASADANSKQHLSEEIQALLEKRLTLEREVAEFSYRSAKTDLQREREQLERDRSQVSIDALPIPAHRDRHWCLTLVLCSSSETSWSNAWSFSESNWHNKRHCLSKSESSVRKSDVDFPTCWIMNRI
jgi:chorismate mutase